MYWTLELASYLEDAPWPATKDELIDFSMRTGAPLEVVENLQQLEDDGSRSTPLRTSGPTTFQGRTFLQRGRVLNRPIAPFQGKKGRTCVPPHLTLN